LGQEAGMFRPGGEVLATDGQRLDRKGVNHDR
jgi:hypothetical protein